MSDYDMPQQAMYPTGPATPTGLTDALVPAIATGIILAIPGAVAIFFTILHVTLWRRDNRAMKCPPFSHQQIKSKVLAWGRIYGVGTVAVMQGFVELLLHQELSWYLRGAMAVIALVATGPVSRLAYDWTRGYAAGKAEEGSRRWLRVYNYLTVEHRAETANGSDDTFCIRRDPDQTPTPKP